MSPKSGVAPRQITKFLNRGQDSALPEPAHLSLLMLPHSALLRASPQNIQIVSVYQTAAL